CWAVPNAAPAMPATAPVAPAAAAPMPAALPPATDADTAGATTRIRAGRTSPAAASSSIEDTASITDGASAPELSQKAVRYNSVATGLNSNAATMNPIIVLKACLPVLSEYDAAASGSRPTTTTRSP